MGFNTTVVVLNDMLAEKQLAPIIAAYEEKCMVVIAEVFHASGSQQKAFRGWLASEFDHARSAVVLLHDDPLYTVGRFLKIPRTKIDGATLKRAKKLAKAS